MTPQIDLMFMNVQKEKFPRSAHVQNTDSTYENLLTWEKDFANAALETPEVALFS